MLTIYRLEITNFRTLRRTEATYPTESAALCAAQIEWETLAASAGRELSGLDFKSANGGQAIRAADSFGNTYTIHAIPLHV